MSALIATRRSFLGSSSLLLSGAADPMVQFTAFGPSSLDFVVRFWTADDDHGHRLKSIVGIAVLDALIAAKIEIPFPQQDVRVRKLAPEPAHEEGRREGE